LLVQELALSSLARVFEHLEIRWVLIGAMAANRYRGSTRLTQDVDLLLANLGPGLDAVTSALAGEGWELRWSNPEGEILRLRHPKLGSADILVAGTDYQHEAISRARTEWLADDFRVSVLTPEDVIVHKLIAGRAQDIADIEAILAADGPLDAGYIERWSSFWEVSDLWRRLRSFARPSMV